MHWNKLPINIIHEIFLYLEQLKLFHIHLSRTAYHAALNSVEIREKIFQIITVKSIQCYRIFNDSMQNYPNMNLIYDLKKIKKSMNCECQNLVKTVANKYNYKIYSYEVDLILTSLIEGKSLHATWLAHSRRISKCAILSVFIHYTNVNNLPEELRLTDTFISRLECRDYDFANTVSNFNLIKNIKIKTKLSQKITSVIRLVISGDWTPRQYNVHNCEHHQDIINRTNIILELFYNGFSMNEIYLLRNKYFKSWPKWGDKYFKYILTDLFIHYSDESIIPPSLKETVFYYRRLTCHNNNEVNLQNLFDKYSFLKFKY